ncbi:Serine/threonine-protein kinase PknA [bacterium HR41]|nr:Serine/threonine-protein kinase PknA [bacterium HR41]
MTGGEGNATGRAAEPNRGGTGARFAVGDTLPPDGRYRLERLVGRGGSGLVFAASDSRLGRRVAIKVVDRDWAIPRVRREARIAAHLNHPAIVTLFELIELPDALILVYELVDGPDLNRARGSGLRFEEAAVAEIGTAIADALAYAHALGVIHRDVKQHNILLPAAHSAGAPAAKLADFGVARIGVEVARSLIEDTHLRAGRSLTAPGEVIGTLAYMAPEQAQGADVGPAADVWGLGACLYELLDGRSLAELRPTPWSPLPPLEPEARGVPAALADLVTRMVDARAERRPSAAKVREELARFADGGRTTVTQVASDRGGMPWRASSVRTQPTTGSQPTVALEAATAYIAPSETVPVDRSPGPRPAIGTGGHLRAPHDPRYASTLQLVHGSAGVALDHGAVSDHRRGRLWSRLATALQATTLVLAAGGLALGVNSSDASLPIALAVAAGVLSLLWPRLGLVLGAAAATVLIGLIAGEEGGSSALVAPAVAITAATVSVAVCFEQPGLFAAVVAAPLVATVGTGLPWAAAIARLRSPAQRIGVLVCGLLWALALELANGAVLWLDTSSSWAFSDGASPARALHVLAMEIAAWTVAIVGALAAARLAPRIAAATGAAVALAVLTLTAALGNPGVFEGETALAAVAGTALAYGVVARGHQRLLRRAAAGWEHTVVARVQDAEARAPLYPAGWP